MKTKHYLHLVLLCAAVVLPAGCATDNNDNSSANSQAHAKKDDRPVTDRLKVGMSKEDVRAALGNPKGTTTTSLGTEVWQYNDNEKAWIPFYAVSGGKFKYTIVNFDADGKVKEWSTSDHSMF
jgi:outer membrane protein assembly factor BamE (lipoprotein component of BamABCDE complex)